MPGTVPEPAPGPAGERLTMCGRFTLSSPPSVLARLFLLDETPKLSPRFNIAPTQAVAVIRWSEETRSRRLAMHQWGLIPSWAKDPAVGAKMINARSETVAERPAFRSAFRRRRCLVPADGFYEWVRAGNRKQPYHIRMRDGRPFAFAGIWERWKGAGDSTLHTCALLTTVPNELLKPLHHRMPVILPEQVHAQWLDPANQDEAALRNLLQPYPAAGMIAYPVDRRVNNPGIDGKENIDPLDQTDPAP